MREKTEKGKGKGPAGLTERYRGGVSAITNKPDRRKNKRVYTKDCALNLQGTGDATSMKSSSKHRELRGGK